ncbi:MAG: hypothetical protein SV765_06890 [Pseudomonadota bacterium]|nr:hypothetical protein [Pseudomonadota bacterium]
MNGALHLLESVQQQAPPASPPAAAGAGGKGHAGIVTDQITKVGVVQYLHTLQKIRRNLATPAIIVVDSPAKEKPPTAAFCRGLDPENL